MPILLKNDKQLSAKDINKIVMQELEDNLFSKHSSLRDKIIRVSFKGLEPQPAINYFKRYHDYLDDMDCIHWSGRETAVSWTIVYAVLYAYIKQAFWINNSDVFLSLFFDRENDGIKLLSINTLLRSESADAISSAFDKKDFQSFLGNLPYREFSELLIPLFRYGYDDLIARVSDEILYGCPENSDEMLFRKSVLVRLLSLSDTEQAVVWHDAISYGIDYEAIPMKTNKVSMFTAEYPDIELIEVTDEMGNDRSGSEYYSDRYKDTKGFRGIIPYVTENQKMHILYHDGSTKLIASRVREHTICTMSDGSTAHMVVTENSIYRFKETKKSVIISDQEEEE